MLALLIAPLLISLSSLGRVEAADGALDPTFGVGGKVKTGFLDSGFDAASGVAVQNDGKIVAAGIALDSNVQPVLALARYDTNGNLDPTFGVGGKVLTDFPTTSLGFDGLGFHIVLQGDGKIVVAGTVGTIGVPSDFGVARFDTNGNPDASFGSGGRVTTDFFGDYDGVTSVAIQNDGKIVVAGFATKITFDYDFALARYDTNGNLDASFGTSGKVTTDFFSQIDQANDVAIQGDGKIVAVGTVRTAGIDTDFGLVRYDTNGNLDPAFGIGGKVTTDLSTSFFDNASAVVIQGDGKIVVAGTAVGIVPSIDFVLVRYDANGAVDGTFGAGGKVTTDFFGGPDRALDVIIQGDGKIVAVGAVNTNPIDVETFNDFGVARYDTNGNLDQTFGIGGKVVTDFLATEYAMAVAIRPDCKIVVAGLSWPFETADSDFAIACYNSDGCLVARPCPKSQGHWKNNPSIWPVNSLTLGSQSYSKDELLAILNTSTQTDASLILARQLIAAKLNIAAGSDASPVSSTVTHADSLLSGFGGKLPYKVKSSSPTGQSMTADGTVLNNYNNGLLTPGCVP